MAKKIYIFETKYFYGLRYHSFFGKAISASLECTKLNINNYKQEEQCYYKDCICFIIGDNIISYDGFVVDEITNESDIYIIENAIISHEISLGSILESNNKKNKINKTYLMIDRSNGYVKIGKSKDPKHRERTLQSEKPSIEMIYICDDDIEYKLHDEYKDFRKRGEWFTLSEKQIHDICKKYEFKECIKTVK